MFDSDLFFKLLFDPPLLLKLLFDPPLLFQDCWVKIKGVLKGVGGRGRRWDKNH
jgi:hypothetical protein